MSKQMHPSGISKEVVQKVLLRRGRLHAFETLDPAKTALVVIDMDMGTISGGTAGTVAMARHINLLAAGLRQRGGIVAWVTTPIHQATANFRAIFGDELTAVYEEQARTGQATTIWDQLDVQPRDIRATKQSFSAFFPGKCDLHEQLQQQGTQSLLIVGVATNICCESSARDAAELDYEVTLVSDAMVGQTDLHQPTLDSFYRCFGDVRTTASVLGLLNA